MKSPWVPSIAVAALVLIGTSWTAIAQAGRTVTEGVYTEAQAARGQAIYDAQCQACHGPTLAGKVGPPLAGPDFLLGWDKRPLADLVDKIRNTMPATKPGSLSPAQATDLVAHLLETSAFRAGSTELRNDETLKQIVLVAPAGAPRAASSAVSTLASRILSAPPPSNMAQMMRGILFPSSNIVFNVQTQDPGERKAGWQPGTADFSWVTWGAGIYPGWDLVDYAALAIAESAPLLLTPGRRCENGKPVPVDRPDWIQFTADLAEAGRTAYKASQTRNRDAVSDSTNVIADACLRCHQVYRDNRVGRCTAP